MNEKERLYRTAILKRSHTNIQLKYSILGKRIQMKNKAMNALLEMGMPANFKGFRYIAEAMELFEADEIWSMKISMLCYKLSTMYNTTPSAVERSIRHAFSVVLTKGYLEVVEKYLTVQNTTNGNLLTVFFLRLSQEG